MGEFAPGQIVIVDCRDALPKEANKFRSAVVVEDGDLFAADYPNVILVPLTEDENLAAPDLSVAIDPTAENGCRNRCYALAHQVTTASKRQIRLTHSHVTPEQLGVIRRQIEIAVGLD